MKRLLWLGVGLAVGALVVRQVAKAARAPSPAGFADEGAGNSAAGVWHSVGDFIADIRAGMAEREEQIHAAFARGESIADLGLLDDEDDAPFVEDDDVFLVEDDDRIG